MSFRGFKILSFAGVGLCERNFGTGRVIGDAANGFSQHRTTESRADHRIIEGLEMKGAHPTTAGAIYQEHRGVMAGFTAIRN